MLVTARWISSPCASSSSPSARRAESLPRRLVQRGGQPLLAGQVQRVQPLDDHGRRPVAQRALQRVGGAAWDGAGRSPRRRRPPRRSSESPGPAGPTIRAWPGSSVASAASASTACWSPPRGENSASTISADGPQHGALRRARGGAARPRVRGIEEAQGIAEAGEDRVVDVVALQLARLAPDLVDLQGQDRVQQVVQQLGPQRLPLGRARRQRLIDQPRLEEVVLVRDGADAVRLAGEGPRGAGGRGRAACARRRRRQQRLTRRPRPRARSRGRR